MDSEKIRAQLERILAAPAFAASFNLARLLRFVVEEALEGRAANLKEYVIGSQALARGEAFDPRADPIVRVQARNLRAKLTHYYENQGRSDSLIIELPKGAYVPVFRERQSEFFNAGVALSRHRPVAAVWAAAVCGVLGIVIAAWFLRAGIRTRWPQQSETASVEAHDLYLRGRYFANKPAEESLRRSVQYFEQALGKDPKYAAAYAGLAEALNLLVQYGNMAPHEGMPRAKSAALKAIAINPSLAEAYVALGAVLEAYDWNWYEAEKTYRRALALNPQSAPARLWYGLFLWDQGRQQQALPEIERAYQLDPISMLVSMNIASLYTSRGEFDQAIEHFKKVLEMEPLAPKVHIKLGLAYLHKSRREEARAAFARARELSATEPRTLAALAFSYAMQGMKGEARHILAQLEELSHRRYVSAFDMALVHTSLEDSERALDFLERAYQERSSGLVSLKNYHFDKLRTNPRFSALVSRMQFLS